MADEAFSSACGSSVDARPENDLGGRMTDEGLRTQLKAAERARIDVEGDGCCTAGDTLESFIDGFDNGVDAALAAAVSLPTAPPPHDWKAETRGLGWMILRIEAEYAQAKALGGDSELLLSAVRQSAGYVKGPLRELLEAEPAGSGQSLPTDAETP